MHEMEIYSNYGFELYQENVTSEVECMKASLANAAHIMSEQSEALSEAHLMDEGSTMRIIELGRRKELAEDGARHIVHESEAARRRYHSELENAIQHIQAQHHEAQETAEQFRYNVRDFKKSVSILWPRRRRCTGVKWKLHQQDWHPTLNLWRREAESCKLTHRSL